MRLQVARAGPVEGVRSGRLGVATPRVIFGDGVQMFLAGAEMRRSGRGAHPNSQSVIVPRVSRPKRRDSGRIEFSHPRCLTIENPAHFVVHTEPPDSERGGLSMRLGQNDSFREHLGGPAWRGRVWSTV